MMAQSLIPNDVQQSQAQPKASGLVKYEANGETVKLSPDMIVRYLVQGGGNVTQQEVMMFLNLCRFQHLNPFLREAYLVKYGNSPATMIVGKDVFLRRAKANPTFRGLQAGIYVVAKNGQLSQREGTFYMKDAETLVGGWCKVFVDGWQEPFLHSVPLDEYIGRKKGGEVSGQWSAKPATMIRKVAIVQALRDVFPETNSQLYSAEEMGVKEDDLPAETVQAKEPAEPAGGVMAALFGGDA